jgi:hypothetical protein
MELLPIAQFAYNSTKNELIGVLLFFANHGYKPQVYKQLKKDKTIAEQTMIHNNKLKDLYRQLIVNIEFGNIRTK